MTLPRCADVRRVAILLLLVLALPGVAAGVPFEVAFEDAAGDVRGMQGQLLTSAPSVDILRFTSTVENGTVVQRVTMAARPVAPDDSILVRSWYANSTNGSFHTIDLEIRGQEADVTKRFHPYRREGDFYNVTFLDARWGVEGNTWVFAFDAALVENATCFDAGVFASHQPRMSKREPEGFDDAYRRDVRSCLTSMEPAPAVPVPPLVVGIPTAPSVQEAPGSRAPTPGPGVVVVLGLVAGLTVLRSRRSP